MRDPFLPHIYSLMAAGLICTGFSISGYLHSAESLNLGGANLSYPAAVRKIPLAIVGAGLCLSAWQQTQSRKEWQRQYCQWQQQQQRLQMQHHQAELEAHQQVAQLQAAEAMYPQMAAYLEAEVEPVLPDPVPVAPTTSAPAMPGVSTTPIPTSNDPYAYLSNFLEYPALTFGGMGAGKSWTARYIASLKVRAGHQVVVLDPHAANHEWKGIRHVGAGMDYGAIAEFLTDYLKDITTRYQEFNRSGLSEEDWQQQLRSHGRVMSVICEEMTNWADRLPGGIGSKFFKAAMSDSRKVLLPPLFVAHDRTLICLGDAKGLAKLRDSSLLELELIPTIHSTTRKPVASGKGRLKLPGYSQWMEVELPTIDRKITDFTPWSAPVQNSVQPPRQAEPESIQFKTDSDRLNWLNRLYQASPSHPELAELNQFNSAESPKSLDPDDSVRNRIAELKAQGMSKNQIIFVVWGAKAGGSKAYQNAVKEYARLRNELGD